MSRRPGPCGPLRLRLSDYVSESPDTGAGIWECDHMDLYKYLWIYIDIYMDFGYLF